MSELVKIIGEELEEFKKQILEEFLSDLDAEVIISDAEKKIKRIGRRG